MRCKELSQGAKLCYARLRQYAGKEGVAFPKQITLAEELGVNSRQVRGYIKELVKIGLIDSEQIGLGHSNRYYFLDHNLIRLDRQYIATPKRHDTATPILRESVEENHKNVYVFVSDETKRKHNLLDKETLLSGTNIGDKAKPSSLPLSSNDQKLNYATSQIPPTPAYPYVKDAINYYLCLYQETLVVPHPTIGRAKINEIIERFNEVYEANPDDLTYENWQRLINEWFRVVSSPDTSIKSDYKIFHFIKGNMIDNRLNDILHIIR